MKSYAFYRFTYLYSSAVTSARNEHLRDFQGPIAAITFGIIIRDKSLVKVGLRTELIGLFLCLLFGETLALSVVTFSVGTHSRMLSACKFQFINKKDYSGRLEVQSSGHLIFCRGTSKKIRLIRRIGKGEGKGE